VAHQWWGHQVGWKSYHDQWLSEGFAEFTSGLVLELRKGPAVMNNFYEQKRKHILEKQRGAMKPSEQAGPITQGIRLETWQTPGAYDILVYEKGAYVLHMLRMSMRDTSQKNSDQAFMDMMKDFATTYAGKNASTADFQHIVEKHATPTLKISKDGKLDWFFNQWVRGTEIPRYTAKIDVTDAPGGKYHLSGSIAQSEVSENFAAVVPLYVVFDKNSMGKLGQMLLIGNTSKEVNVDVALPKKPKSVVVNAMHDVLAR
jgi:aminopeptidase N